jgi:hypothetical protein
MLCCKNSAKSCAKNNLKRLLYYCYGLLLVILKLITGFKRHAMKENSLTVCKAFLTMKISAST